MAVVEKHGFARAVGIFENAETTTDVEKYL